MRGLGSHKSSITFFPLRYLAVDSVTTSFFVSVATSLPSSSEDKRAEREYITDLASFPGLPPLFRITGLGASAKSGA